MAEDASWNAGWQSQINQRLRQITLVILQIKSDYRK